MWLRRIAQIIGSMVVVIIHAAITHEHEPSGSCCWFPTNVHTTLRLWEYKELALRLEVDLLTHAES